jgi:hypothetical protein
MNRCWLTLLLPPGLSPASPSQGCSHAGRERSAPRQEFSTMEVRHRISLVGWGNGPIRNRRSVDW